MMMQAVLLALLVVGSEAEEAHGRASSLDGDGGATSSEIERAWNAGQLSGVAVSDLGHLSSVAAQSQSRKGAALVRRESRATRSVQHDPQQVIALDAEAAAPVRAKAGGASSGGVVPLDAAVPQLREATALRGDLVGGTVGVQPDFAATAGAGASGMVPVVEAQFQDADGAASSNSARESLEVAANGEISSRTPISAAAAAAAAAGAEDAEDAIARGASRGASSRASQTLTSEQKSSSEQDSQVIEAATREIAAAKAQEAEAERREGREASSKNEVSLDGTWTTATGRTREVRNRGTVVTGPDGFISKVIVKLQGRRMEMTAAGMNYWAFLTGRGSLQWNDGDLWTRSVDCAWGPWSSFGACGGVCEEGSQQRTRDYLYLQENGGQACHGSKEECHSSPRCS